MSDLGPILGGIPVLGPVLDLLTSLFGGQNQVQELAQAVNQVEQAVWANTINMAAWTLGAFGDIASTLGDLAKKIGEALGHLGSIIFGHLKALIDAIIAWLKDIRRRIAALIAQYKALKKTYDAMVGAQMRKILDLIQRVRKILVPFRLLHIAFASNLDALLGKYESDLGAKWAKLVAFDTQVLGVLNDVLTPTALLKPGHLLGSLGMMISSVRQAVGAADVRSLFCLAPLGTPQPLVNPWSTTAALTLGNIQGNTGDYATYQAQRDTALRQYAQDLGVQSIA